MDSLTERMKVVAAEPVVMALGGIVTGSPGSLILIRNGKPR
jgi:hypothetical protein